MRKYKIINDPVHGFITIPGSFFLKIIDSFEFQRLRRISQMGLSELVYPGAKHTRFQHALGAMHLMHKAVDVLKRKNIDISDKEKKGVMAAILLHDVGHGPFSHALEYALLDSIRHEDISMALMKRLNKKMNGKLDLAIEIFTDQYPKKFLYQLISSQLDMDRMDYLQRDSFYTGVVEGRINAERLIAMLNVHNQQLVVEEKGIYSVEKFIVSRRFMYWQVYLHKTSFMFEKILEQTLRRAKYLHRKGEKLYLDENLDYFFSHSHLTTDEETLDKFIQLTDEDIMFHLKKWIQSNDPVLSFLSKSIVRRKPFRVEIRQEPFKPEQIEKIKEKISNSRNLTKEDVSFLVLEGKLQNQAYELENDPIYILLKSGKVEEFSQTTDQMHIRALSGKVEKYFLIYPKDKI